ncbi:protein TolQ [Pararhodospirillum oryzae]|uniref:Tol-Pal system protein TolQ n=1 Tax=Pararhodospirillum oryzae TaxID=478448 RepID=A0A512HBU1_9PROT|nr:protein TolQ [Pararhodospirillum oryzae]GEO82916.1 Tol-Pal system subunit TolQ [Pararhodospirillum oryzae]
MELLYADAITHLLSHVGADALDGLSRALTQAGHAMGSGFDVQVQPPAPRSAPTMPVERELLPGAAATPSHGLGSGASGASGSGLTSGATAPGTGAAPASAPPAHHLSVVGLFMQADLIVKTVMMALMGASVWCWTIIIEKSIRIRDLNRKAERFEEKFWSGSSLEDLFDRIGQRPRDPMSAVFVAAMREWRLAAQRRGGPAGPRPLLAQRIERVMGITMSRELDVVSSRLGFLASTGSVAPFVGLFGTVWGIMNSFSAIGQSQDTSLATVAPGIAEALFATALGLVAAIPAVIAYNKLSSDIDRYAGRLEAFSGEFGAILGRQLDDRE